MPTVAVKRDTLFKRLGRTYEQDEFELLLFEFGIELDDVTTEAEMQQKETGKSANASEEVIYKIDVPANRYDLLCLEGIVRNLRVFLSQIEPPVYTAVLPKKAERLVVSPETAAIRPFVVAAILRGVTFTEESYASFIDLQDKLHQNICRRRTIVAIGTHDYDAIEGPFTYEALKPEDINFVPLRPADKSYSARELMAVYEQDMQLKKYLHIIKDAPRYPVIYDAKRRVLSMPPIINGDHSKIKLETRNVFIECTATDITKARVVINTMCAMFSEYCAAPFETEQVEVVMPDGSASMSPDFSTYPIEANVDYINKAAGINLSAEECQISLKKMCLPGTLVNEGKTIRCDVPITRSDVMHGCDIMEDVAIGYGFNNIEKTIPACLTVGKQFPINKLSDLLRQEVAAAGYTEVATLALCSTEENFDFLNHEDDGKTAIKLANPKTFEYQVARTSLLPGILKTVAHNQKDKKPIKVFEVSDIVRLDAMTDVGASNRRHIGGMYCGSTSGFENVHGLLDRTMLALSTPMVAVGEFDGYYLQPSEDATFMAHSRADIYYRRQKIGAMGIIHPSVLHNFRLDYPASYFEIDLEPFLEE